MTFASINCLWQIQTDGYSITKKYFWQPRFFILIACIGAVAVTLWLLLEPNIWLDLALSFMIGSLAYTLRHNPPLCYTKRLRRQMVALMVLLAIVAFFLPFWVVVFLLPLWNIVAFGVMLPFEKHNNRRYVEQARAKMVTNKCTKIAIVGSYAKTSVKNILNTILSEKFVTLVTPNSVNTPLGISAFVNSRDINNSQVCIFEMGARRQGEIAELRDLVRPDLAILTGITGQHLATFRTLDRVIATKSEILYIDGTVVMNGLDDNVCELGVGQSTKLVVGRQTDSIYATELACDSQGSYFTLHTPKGVIRCHTKLIGEHNITNILLCVGIAVTLGMNTTQIKRGIAKITQIPHRLQIIHSGNNIIIDDSYNANIEGVAVAIKAMKLFDGRKFIITQGIVESNSHTNILVGKIIAEVADKVVVIGRNSADIIKGLKEKHFDPNNILHADCTKTAVDMLMKDMDGAVLLFQNDIPK